MPTVGIPHFRGKINDIRRGTMNLLLALVELLGNIDKQDECRIKIDRRTNNHIYRLSVSDNKLNGMQNIDKSHAENPLNMSCISESHADNSVENEFGMGLKLAAIATCDKLTVYTKCLF